MNAKEVLAALQRDRARTGGTGRSYDAAARDGYVLAMEQADPHTRHVMAENLTRIDADHARLQALLPTPEQSVQDFARLTRAKESLDETLRSGGDLPPRGNVILGSVEHENVNALSTYFPQSDEYLVVFNRALLAALLRYTNYVGWVWTLDDRINHDVEPRLGAAYRDLLSAVNDARMPDPRHTAPFPPTANADEAQIRQLRWQLMEDFATDFVFSHEYMHILLGHLDGSKNAVPDEDHGGWGHEYEADSSGLELLVATHMNKWHGESVPIVLMLQSVSLFFLFVSHVERFGAEVLGRADAVWRHDRSHPPTWVRFGRLLGDLSRYPYLPWPQIGPRIEHMTQSLDVLYTAATSGAVKTSVPSLEWRFQRLAFESLALGLFPQHLAAAARCVQMTLASGTLPNLREIATCMTEVNQDLAAHGIAATPDRSRPLATAVSRLGTSALQTSRLVGPGPVHEFADELHRIAMRDARTRFPAASS